MDERINFFINKNNNLDKQGRFFNLFKSLFHLRKSTIIPVLLNLKQMLGECKKNFNNKNYDDANEYLNVLIEILHEGINLYSDKKDIEINEKLFNYNTVEEVGNFYWSYNLRRNASFIDSIFLFQLKSHLKCIGCGNVKYNFENNYILNLPLPIKKVVNVEIYLYKLPFNLKLYYSEINPKFREYIEKEKNKNKTTIKNLMNYYIDELTFEERKIHSEKLYFNFNLNIKKTIIDLVKVLREIKLLELEQEKFGKLFKSEEIEFYKIKHLTDFIIYSDGKKHIIHPDEYLDKYINEEGKINIYVYEVLNSEGMRKLLEANNIFNNIRALYSFTSINDKPNSVDEIKNKLYFQNKELNENKNFLEKNDVIILSLKDKMVYIRDQEIKQMIGKNYNFYFEFVLPIHHYKVVCEKSRYLFRSFYHVKIKDFPMQYIILNSEYHLSAKNLYEYIWNSNK